MTSPEFQWLEDDVLAAVKSRLEKIEQGASEATEKLRGELLVATQKAMIAEAKHRDRAQVASATSADWEARAMADRATNVELTKKIGELNARIDELTQAKPEESKLEVRTRCPDCGGDLALDGGGMRWRRCVPCQKSFSVYEVWRRWGDTEKADGIYWVKWSDDRRARAVNAAYHNLDDTHWVLGPLSEPHVPAGGE